MESPGYIFNDAVIIILLISAALLILMYCYAKIVLVISYTASQWHFINFQSKGKQQRRAAMFARCLCYERTHTRTHTCPYHNNHVEFAAECDYVSDCMWLPEGLCLSVVRNISDKVNFNCIFLFCLSLCSRGIVELFFYYNMTAYFILLGHYNPP